MIERVRLEFEAGRVEGIYFPLQRHGQYYAVLKRPIKNSETGALERNPDGTVAEETAFAMFDSEVQMRAELPEWQRDGWEARAQGFKGQDVAQLDQVSEGFVAQVVEQLAGQGDAKQADQVFQMYLDVLPYLSARKHFIHRKKTPGYAADLARTYAFNMSHLANQIARMEVQPALSASVEMMRAEAKAKQRAGESGGDAVREEELIAEFERRYDWIMSPSGAPWASRLTGIGFLWFLGLSPAAALVNLTQTPLVALPELAGRFGFKDSSTALTKAMGEVIAARRRWGTRRDYQSWRGLADEDRAMLDWAHEVGAIDATNVHSLMEISEGGDKQFGRAWSKTMEGVGLMFHEAEIVNREATLLAGYRLARAQGMGEQRARQVAADHMWASHGDYSNANRARWLQPNVAKVVFLFKQYSQLMTWYLGRNAWQMVRGASAEERAAAGKRLGGVLGMTMVFAGSMGLPAAVTWPAFLIAEAAHALISDDDEPWDAQTAWRDLLADFGIAGQVLDRGAVNALTGADVASRVALDQLFFRDPWADDMGGRESYNHWVAQLLGPLGSIAQNAFMAGDDLEQGEVLRAAERLTPTAIKNVLQAVRWTGEGVTNRQGEPVVARADLSPWELFLKANGMTPDQVSAQYDMNRAVKNYEAQATKQRARLLTAYWFAHLDGDRAGRMRVLEKIERYNAGRPAKPIDRETLTRSVRTRERYRNEAVAGVNLDPDYRYLAERARVAM
jgi:hypothetical protein